MSDQYLVALAFHFDNPSDLSPSAASVAQYESTLSVRYDAAIRKALPGHTLDPAELRYISVLAVLSAGQTVAAQVRDACRFYLALEPEVPPSGSSAFVARETLAMVAGDGAVASRALSTRAVSTRAVSTRAGSTRAVVRTPSPGRKKAVKKATKQAAKQPAKQRTGARKATRSKRGGIRSSR